MELYKTKIAGSEINVIFCGSVYLFHSSFYGYIATASRQESTKNIAGGRVENFVITYGNRHTIGGRLCDSRIYSGVVRFLRKVETEHGATAVTTVEDRKDLADAWLDLAAAFRIPA